MSLGINLGTLKANSVQNNASITIGPALHNSHSVQMKLFGNNISIGDYSPPSAVFNNQVDDRDLVDQSLVGNSDRTYYSDTL
ncbi:spore germination protein [Virgibacillus sp. 179-BFC.A HS]|uniref:Spore germination protein n=1 Tax=Tigheibacillus jepli TaxID=3035914 RepID=A0ABU5CFE8_9BACI|nr:spore germination protein [Virgibacillus sp. 179-BFC.A HS]MDY0404245.1 spore germination protein [Virgibacillus sp. 179-BFC.A HS]